MPETGQVESSIVGAYLYLTVPMLLLLYGAFLLFIRPTGKVFRWSLWSGVLLALVQFGVDQLAYYANWWKYTLQEVVFNVPLPFYLSSLFIFGSLTYLLVWRLWWGKYRWISFLLLIAVPAFLIFRDVSSGLTDTAYQHWENIPMALTGFIVMWLVGFFGGFALFWRVASKNPYVPQTEEAQPLHKSEPSHSVE